MLFNAQVMSKLLFPFLMAFLVVFGLFSFAVGVGLIVSSQRMFRLFDLANSWVSTREWFRVLEKPHDISPVVYKYRRWVGTVFVLGGIFAIYGLALKSAKLVITLHSGLPSGYVMWLIDSARWLLILGSLLALVVGILLLWAPRTLDSLAAKVDRWYAPTLPSERMDVMHTPLDRLVRAYPRASGWIIAAASLFVVIAAWVLWRKSPW